MEQLTLKETKFLTILNETRLADGKMFGRYFNEVKENFQFTNQELSQAVSKFIRLDLLSQIDAGGGEIVYFHTNKVEKIELDQDLLKIRH